MSKSTQASAKQSTIDSAAETVATLDDHIETAEEVVSASPSEAVEPTAIAANHHGFSGKKVRLIINAGEGDAGSHAVFVGLGDYSAQIPRDVEVSIPYEVFEMCIKNAKYTTYVRTKAGLEERTINRHSYSMLGFE